VHNINGESPNRNDDEGASEIWQSNTDPTAGNDTKSPDDRMPHESASAKEIEITPENAGSEEAGNCEPIKSSEMIENDSEPSHSHDGNNWCDRLTLDSGNFADEAIPSEMPYLTDRWNTSQVPQASKLKIRGAGEGPMSVTNKPRDMLAANEHATSRENDNSVDRGKAGEHSIGMESPMAPENAATSDAKEAEMS
jgi:hypothetical protein